MLIPVKAFGLIDQLPNGEVEISGRSRGGRNAIMIRAGDSIKNVFETMDAAEYPRGSLYAEGNERASIDGADLAGALRNVLYAVSRTGEKPSMCAVCMESRDGNLSFMGLNGQQVAWDMIPFEGNFRLLIPRSSAEQLITLSLEGDVIINYSSLYASFQSEEYVVQTRLVDGDYFNVAKLFREDNSFRIDLQRESFAKAVRRADMCNETAKPVPVRIDLEGDNLTVYIKSSTAAYSETLPINTEINDKLTIGFNPALLRTTLDSFADDNVEALFSSPKMPMIVKSKTSRLRALILPVMVR